MGGDQNLNTISAGDDKSSTLGKNTSMERVKEIYDIVAPLFASGGDWFWLKKSTLPHLIECQNEGLIPKNPSIIDCGVGSANNAIDVVNALGGSFIGIEFSQEMLKNARKNIEELNGKGMLIEADFRDRYNPQIKSLYGGADLLLDIGASDGRTYFQHMHDLLRFTHEGTLLFSVVFDLKSDLHNNFVQYQSSATALEMRGEIAVKDLELAHPLSGKGQGTLKELEATREKQKGIPHFSLKIEELVRLFINPVSASAALRDMILLASNHDYDRFNKEILRPNGQDIEKFVEDTGAHRYKVMRGAYQPYFVTCVVTEEMKDYVNQMANEEAFLDTVL